MKIGVDLTSARSPLSGVGYYSLELVAPMVKQRPQDTFLLYSYEMTPQLQEMARHKNVIPVIARPTALPWRQHLQRQVKMRCQFLRPVDVYWSLTQWFPRIRFAKRTVVTVYDFFHFICPEDVASVQLRRLLRHGGRSIQEADAVVAISQGTKNFVQEFHGIVANEVVQPAIRSIFRPYNATELAPFLDQQGLSYRGYALTVANIEPRKNLDKLLNGYLSALEQFGPARCMPLVVVGKTSPTGGPIVEQLNRARERYPNHIRFAGRVDDEVLVKYLSGAAALFLMSRYEGYGMPLAEARCCGTPVVCSDIPEMREAAQEDGVFVPLDQWQRLPALFLKDGASFSVKPATYPTADELALKMGQVFDSLF